jgi:hypothetical protein
MADAGAKLLMGQCKIFVVKSSTLPRRYRPGVDEGHSLKGRSEIDDRDKGEDNIVSPPDQLTRICSCPRSFVTEDAASLFSSTPGTWRAGTAQIASSLFLPAGYARFVGSLEFPVPRRFPPGRSKNIHMIGRLAYD